MKIADIGWIGMVIMLIVLPFLVILAMVLGRKHGKSR